MLEALRVQGFKSLTKLEVLDLPRMAVLFGPNAAGKSNVLDAILTLSRMATSRTLSEAVQEPIRGHPIEAFTFPAGGLPELLAQPAPQFTIGAHLLVGNDRYQYRIGVRIHPKSGSMVVSDEYLAALTAKGTPKGSPSIEVVGDDVRIRRKSKPAHPRQESLGLNHAILSDPRLSGVEYRAIERCRTELSGWRTYYLDPRVAMRRDAPPAEVQDIGVLGENIAPFLYRLRGELEPKYRAIVRTLRSIIPSIDEVSVDLNKHRGTLDILIRQQGTDFSSRIVSEGTLRVLALCAVAINPWGGSLIAFEEPENGVHPRRLELVAELLTSLALGQRRQLVVTTHSPLFCSVMARKARAHSKDIGLFSVGQSREGTTMRRFDPAGPLFESGDIAKRLSTIEEDRAFEGLVLRGLLDE